MIQSESLVVAPAANLQRRPQPLVYRINVAMAHLGVSRTTIYRMVNAGELELVKISARASGITVASINALLTRNSVKGKENGS